MVYNSQHFLWNFSLHWWKTWKAFHKVSYLYTKRTYESQNDEQNKYLLWDWWIVIWYRKLQCMNVIRNCVTFTITIMIITINIVMIIFLGSWLTPNPYISSFVENAIWRKTIFRREKTKKRKTTSDYCQHQHSRGERDDDDDHKKSTLVACVPPDSKTALQPPLFPWNSLLSLPCWIILCLFHFILFLSPFFLERLDKKSCLLHSYQYVYE